MLMAGAAVSGIAKQILLLPFLDHLLFFVQRVVARAGGNHRRDRLLAGPSAAGTELVVRVIILQFFGRSRFHTPLTFVSAQGDEDFSVLGAVRKKRCGGVPSSTPHKPLCSVTRSGRKKIITLPRGPLQLSPCQQVNMQVKHRLPGIGAIVLYQAEASFGQPPFAGQLTSYTK